MATTDSNGPYFHGKKFGVNDEFVKNMFNRSAFVWDSLNQYESSNYGQGHDGTIHMDETIHFEKDNSKEKPFFHMGFDYGQGELHAAKDAYYARFGEYPEWLNKKEEQEKQGTKEDRWNETADAVKWAREGLFNDKKTENITKLCTIVVHEDNTKRSSLIIGGIYYCLPHEDASNGARWYAVVLAIGSGQVLYGISINGVIRRTQQMSENDFFRIYRYTNKKMEFNLR